MDKFCILYEENGEVFHTITDTPFNEWQESHPDVKVTHAFPMNCDMVKRFNSYEQQWVAYARRYGVDESALHKQFRNPRDNHIHEFIGFNIKNHKYKFITLDITANRRIKITTRLAQDLLEHPVENLETAVG